MAWIRKALSPKDNWGSLPGLQQMFDDVEATYGNGTVARVVEDATNAAVEAIAEAFPDIETGDVAPGELDSLEEEMRKAVIQWVSNNSNRIHESTKERDYPGGSEDVD